MSLFLPASAWVIIPAQSEVALPDRRIPGASQDPNPFCSHCIAPQIFGLASTAHPWRARKGTPEEYLPSLIGTPHPAAPLESRTESHSVFLNPGTVTTAPLPPVLSSAALGRRGPFPPPEAFWELFTHSLFNPWKSLATKMHSFLLGG